MGGADSNRGVSIPVSTSVSNEYQILNPNQLYPSYASQSVSRMKPPSNYNKPPVHKQETDCRYGVSSLFIYTMLLFIVLLFFIVSDYFYSNLKPHLAIFAIHTILQIHKLI